MARSKNLFKEVPVKKVGSNLFDLSHQVNMSGKFGFLYPCLIKDVMPGDYWRGRTRIMVRMAPMLAPVYHRINVTVHDFYVPYRILYTGWPEFITGGKNGTYTDTTAPYWTYHDLPSFEAPDMDPIMGTGSLLDYLGFPTFDGIDHTVDVLTNTNISAFPLMAYLKVFSDYYIDPNLDAEIDFTPLLLGGNQTNNLYTAGAFSVRRRGWERDYFTGCLPWAQRGPEVLIPMEGEADVTYTAASLALQEDGNTLAAGNVTTGLTVLKDSANESIRIENIDEITVANTTITINDLRRSMALQRWLEVNARGGHRYNEQIWGHFQVRVPDFRVQRAEYLGGGRVPVVIDEVRATANSTFDTEEQPLGDLAGYGLAVGDSNHFTYFAQEHGIIISIVSVMPVISYAGQGLDRVWTRADRFDWPWHEFAHIGEQEVLSRELFFDVLESGEAANNLGFGYNPRYSEMKYAYDRIAGDFKTSLNFWQLVRNFTARPTLDSAFLAMHEDGVASDEETFRRIFYVNDGTDYLWMTLYHDLKVQRKLPYFGVPGGI